MGVSLSREGKEVRLSQQLWSLDCGAEKNGMLSELKGKDSHNSLAQLSSASLSPFQLSEFCDPGSVLISSASIMQKVMLDSCDIWSTPLLVGEEEEEDQG